jgi:hypothetical protein
MRAATITTGANDQLGEFTATWMLLSDNADFFRQPEVARSARQPREIQGLRPWTDDFSGLLPVLHW